MSMEKLLMDLQVFAQEFHLREHMAMKFSWNLSFPFERIKHFDQAKLSLKIRAQVTYL